MVGSGNCPREIHGPQSSTSSSKCDGGLGFGVWWVGFGLVWFGWLVGWLVKSLLSYAGGDSIKMVPQPRNITPLDQSKLGPSRVQFSRLFGLVGFSFNASLEPQPRARRIFIVPYPSKSGLNEQTYRETYRASCAVGSTLLTRSGPFP